MDVNEDTFPKNLPQNGGALVVFKATWCGPCKALSPVVDALATANPGLPVLKVDIDGSPNLARKFNVRAVPAPFWVTVTNGVVTGAERLQHGPMALRLAVQQKLAAR